MSRNASNDYVRCSDCQTVYEATRPFCPNCGTENSKPVYESKDGKIDESYEPVFNLLD